MARILLLAALLAGCGDDTVSNDLSSGDFSVADEADLALACLPGGASPMCQGNPCAAGCKCLVLTTLVDIDDQCIPVSGGQDTDDGDYGSNGTPTASPVTYALFDLRPADVTALETVAFDIASSPAAAANDRNSTTFAKIASASKSGSFAMGVVHRCICGNNMFQQFLFLYHRPRLIQSSAKELRR